jgi:hypothetical protein
MDSNNLLGILSMLAVSGKCGHPECVRFPVFSPNEGGVDTHNSLIFMSIVAIRRMCGHPQCVMFLVS